MTKKCEETQKRKVTFSELVQERTISSVCTRQSIDFESVMFSELSMDNLLSFTETDHCDTESTENAFNSKIIQESGSVFTSQDTNNQSLELSGLLTDIALHSEPHNNSISSNLTNQKDLQSLELTTVKTKNGADIDVGEDQFDNNISLSYETPDPDESYVLGWMLESPKKLENRSLNRINLQQIPPVTSQTRSESDGPLRDKSLNESISQQEDPSLQRNLEALENLSNCKI